MANATRALVVAIISAVVFLPLVFFEVVVFLLAGMITYEPSNPWFIKVAAVAAVLLVAAVALALPLAAVVMGARSRRLIRSSEAAMPGASKALAAQVIGGIVTVGVVIVQIYLVLMAAGVCSLDGC
ncbi:MAG TPA: hypothetical protein DCQ36_09290 [Actinobacteria bacterium]|jgi:hypothetical protein|nr:hypothetical protein [Actinomycetota bacterium]